jgi:hypothetical protein
MSAWRKIVTADGLPPVALVRFPADPTRPIFIRFEGVPIEIAVCSRETYAAKNEMPPESWSVNGVYILSAPRTDDARKTRVRPGTTLTRPLLERVDEHLRAVDMKWWQQVVLVRRLTRAFDSAEAPFLETLLHDPVDAAVYLERDKSDKRSNFPGPSNTDATADLAAGVFHAIKVGLRLAGLRLETQAELDAMLRQRPRRRADEKLA